MGKTFKNIPSLEEYEQYDFDKNGEDALLRIGKITFSKQDQIIHRFKNKVCVFNEETEEFEQVINCYYSIYGLFIQKKDYSKTWIKIPKFHHWDIKNVDDKKFFTAVICNTASLLIYDKLDLKEYLDFCNGFNACVDNYSQMAIDNSLNCYRLLINNEKVKRATLNFLEMLSESIFTDYATHVLFLYCISLADTKLEQFIAMPSEIKENAYKILHENREIAATIFPICDSFHDFESLISERFNVSTSSSSLVVYLLLIQLASEKYTNIWKKEYDQNIECDNIPEYTSNSIENHILTEQDMYGTMLLSWIYIHFSDDLKIGILDAYSVISHTIKETNQKLKTDLFANRIFNEHIDALPGDDGDNSLTIDDIDLMTGIEFEQFLVHLFAKKKFEVHVTKKTGDQGIDIIIEKNGIRTGIQAKCYGSNVGNSAIQEAVAGKRYYNLNKVMVITNSYFTNAATELAKTNNVILWDRSILKDKI